MTDRTQRHLAIAALAACGMCVAPAARAADVELHGLLTVVAAERGEAHDYNRFIRGDAPFDAYTLRLSPTAHVNDRLDVYGQIVLNDASGIYVDGAYLQYTPWATRDLHVLAGKVPWSIGTYAPRTYADRNPLIGTPLMYQYHSSLLWYDLPLTADGLLSASGSGQTGVGYAGYAMGSGMTLVDDSYWDAGATIVGSMRPLEYAFGVSAGTPGWGSTSKDENSGRTVLGRIGIAPLPGVRFGVSGAYGPYLDAAVSPELPPGARVEDYHQKLAMADLELLAGHAELRAEGANNVWESPFVGDLEVTSGYVELKYAMSFGGFVAGRMEATRFGKLADSSGAEHPWDADVTRGEAGVGYRFDRSTVAKLVVQSMTIDKQYPAPERETLSIVAAQIAIAF